jgi:hypothetical protein
VTIDVPVALTALSNGDETTLLLFPVDPSGASLALHPGRYTLTLRVQRTRWRTSVSDPSAVYDQSRAIALAW